MSPMGEGRLPVSEGQRAEAAGRIFHGLDKRLAYNGDKAFIGPHEILGIITEEYIELVGAVTSNQRERVINELVDVAVGCLWGVASLIAQRDASLYPPVAQAATDLKAAAPNTGSVDDPYRALLASVWLRVQTLEREIDHALNDVGQPKS